MKKTLSLAAAALALLALGGCATNPLMGTGTPQASAQGYTMQGAQSVQSVQLGTVLAVHAVVIAGQGSGAGAIGGALAGLMGGQALEGAAAKESGLLVTVKLDDGRMLAITQAADVQLSIGERVQVLMDRTGKARALPLG